MIPKPIEEITKEDIENLLIGGVSEGRRLDYKREFPDLDKPDKKKRFLQAVAAFANAEGGDIVFGVEDEAGAPADIRPIKIEDTDKLELHIRNTIRGNFDPAIFGIQFRAIPGWDVDYVLVVRVPPSWSAPHMITQGSGDKTNSRFYMRHGNGNQAMDVSEIRSSFLRSEGRRTRLQNIRDERIAIITRNRSPVVLRGTGRVALHSIPAEALGAQQTVSIEEAIKWRGELAPIKTRARDYRFNFDGFLLYAGEEEGARGTYAQLFRNGMIEAATSRLLRDDPGGPYLDSPRFEKEVIEAAQRYLTLHNKLNLTPPVCSMLSLLNVKNCRLMHKLDHTPEEAEFMRTQQDNLIFPDVMFESFDSPVAETFRPIFDMLWQSFGLSKCPWYDAQGRWTNPVPPLGL